MEEKEDIVPGLLENIQEDFRKNFSVNEKIKELYKKIQDGSATYQEAYEFAEHTGTILAQSFEKHLNSSILPEGKMYYNIADRILRDTLKENYDLIVNATSQIQKKLNENAGIGIKPIVPGLNQDRIDGLVNKISSAENYDDVAWVFDEPVKTFSLSVVDDSIKKNAEFHSKAGLSPKIIRKSESKCCKWCGNLAGSYTYPDNVPDDVYRRHENCRCTVDYNPGDGKNQNVHSKQWRNEDLKKESRKTFGLKDTKQAKEERIVKAKEISSQKRMQSGNHSGIIKVEKTTLEAWPNSITEVINKKGGIDRNYYNNKGLQIKQISNNNHGKPKQHPFGSHGEHAHDYIYDENGKLIKRPIRDLTDVEREENKDIL